MFHFDTYALYWPIIAASALFLILGLWWRLSAARAMELAPKELSWVRKRPSSGFPFLQELLQKPGLRWPFLLLTLVLAAAFAAAKLANTGMIYVHAPDLFFRSRYGLVMVLLWCLGGAAIYLSLNILFGSLWVSLPGTLLFLSSAARGHGEACMMAVTLLLVLLYLRAEKPGFPAELLYLAAVLSLAPLLALRPGLLWLFLCLPCAHWYKLIHQRRSFRLSGGQLSLALLLSLLAWVLCLGLAVLLFRFLAFGFQAGQLLIIAQPKRFLNACRLFLTQIPRQLFAAPTPGMTIDLMVDAPLFGFGLWGCCSAWRMAHARRDSVGALVLILLAALLALWLITGRYVLTLGLTLSTACILQDAFLGRKRTMSILLPLAGMLWYIGISVAAWYVPLTVGLQGRLV